MGKTRKYLCTQVEVAEQNCCLGAGDDQNNENQKEESKHVVHLVRPAKQKDNTWETPAGENTLHTDQDRQHSSPDTVEDKKELDEDAAERQNSTHDYSWNWLCEEWLLRNLTGDLVCPHRLFNRLQRGQNQCECSHTAEFFFWVVMKITPWGVTYSFFESKVGTDEGEWHRDSKPQS